MITRSANKKDMSIQADGVVEQSQKNNIKITKNSNEDDIDDSILQNFPSPTFNIHIHVPCHDPNNAKLLLPRIQPIIHLHFDEIAKRLEATMKGQNEKSLSKTFENLLTKTSPKFGDVKFHFKINSEEKEIENTGISNETSCSSHRDSNDIELNKNGNYNSVSNQNVVPDISKEVAIECSNNGAGKSNSKKSCNNQGLSNYKVDGNIKLKKAVVVLTDICKSKNYKKILAGNNSAKNQNNENESLYDCGDKLDNICKDKQDYIPYLIKTEKESCTPGSLTPDWCKNIYNISDGCSADVQEENEIRKSALEKMSRKGRNLTSLVEGWNFSDILNRFQIKHSEFLMDSAKYFNHTIESITDPKKDDFEINEKKKEMEGSYEEIVGNSCKDGESCLEVNENKIAIKEDNYLSDNESGRTVSPSLLPIKNETENIVFPNHLDNLDENTVCDEKKITPEELNTEFPENQCHHSESDSDECENISGKEVSSEVILDLELVEHDLSSNKSNFVYCENKIEEGTIKNSYLREPDFHLMLIQKKMQQETLNHTAIYQTPQNSQRNKSSEAQSTQSDSTPSPKKMKHSNKESKNSGQKLKSSETKDYILVNSSGPTQFAVASLNNVIPLKAHEAKDFKRKMLFGNRVNRFSSSDQLRVQQLKREATRKSLN